MKRNGTMWDEMGRHGTRWDDMRQCGTRWDIYEKANGFWAAKREPQEFKQQHFKFNTSNNNPIKSDHERL
ncbi:hypothetical protein [uncultured Bartonella sp.]|uniref:hypothetical protein n=1 Tax=uncultured Bartonella sp. TaxID=104108 RepID=UPI0025F08044|nr:hypothetical protein [uncultured Bartonella sp.]